MTGLICYCLLVMVLFNEEVLLPTWIAWIVLGVYSIEAILVVVLLGATYSLTGIIYMICIGVQSIALACGVLWRLNRQPALLPPF